MTQRYIVPDDKINATAAGLLDYSGSEDESESEGLQLLMKKWFFIS